jgi:hypothetical protein
MRMEEFAAGLVRADWEDVDNSDPNVLKLIQPFTDEEYNKDMVVELVGKEKTKTRSFLIIQKPRRYGITCMDAC